MFKTHELKNEIYTILKNPIGLVSITFQHIIKIDLFIKKIKNNLFFNGSYMDPWKRDAQALADYPNCLFQFSLKEIECAFDYICQTCMYHVTSPFSSFSIVYSSNMAIFVLCSNVMTTRLYLKMMPFRLKSVQSKMKKFEKNQNNFFLS